MTPGARAGAGRLRGASACRRRYTDDSAGPVERSASQSGRGHLGTAAGSGGSSGRPGPAAPSDADHGAPGASPATQAPATTLVPPPDGGTATGSPTRPAPPPDPTRHPSVEPQPSGPRPALSRSAP